MKKQSFFLRIALLFAIVLAFGAAPAIAQDNGGFTLTILHTNDTHARIEQFAGSGSTCSEEQAASGACVGGVARRATKIAELMGTAMNPLLVDAGDQFQGSLYYTQYRGEEAAEFMPMLGYQAMTIGNHEFDDGPANLARFIDSVGLPVLSANIDASADPDLAGKILPYTVLDVNGEQVGVIGLTTDTTPFSSSPGDTVAFGEYVASLEPVIAELEALGVNKIVLLSHIGYADDQMLAAAIDGIDVIVGGHSHTLLANTIEGASGPYPTVVDSPSGAPVLIVQAEAYGKYLGNLEVTFDADGVASAWQGEPILLDASVAEDPDVLARVQALGQPLAELRNTVVGQSAIELDGSRTSCRFGECTMGNLIADAMLWATQNDGAQVAIENGGGIRASLPAGDVTMGGVLEVLPFGNLAATLGLKGSDLLLALENGVSRAENPDNEGTGRFPQVAGIRFSWDGSKPAGERIVSAEVRNADGSYSPIDPDAVYQVVTNDFMRRGGDEYTIFAEAAINPYDFGSPLDQILADYIAAFSPVNPVIEGRITRVDSAEPTPTPAPTEEPTPSEPPAALPTTGAGFESWPLLAALLVLTALAATQIVRQRSMRNH
ncbi:MAG TPA: multifunctional 2',3'-cyclic-nucleotide 2'-phosphodiesterase/5'-nucleotidase/3'-nucleotidase [Chloroflexi bacterium]|nr:multifunctional 2',3'-cyclic-nucleotide 2'-phosphodiesterase/5'-nucleotidase/3'-nucleotidase [Chloroflexota bacterium]HHW85947.1 multifunctional 2',3'-cyclic-nucleotide 2'-phosphodiesterase/5'-nucleotidase/3'-nucleotidase [Chloroflexota bacterium]